MFIKCKSLIFFSFVGVPIGNRYPILPPFHLHFAFIFFAGDDDVGDGDGRMEEGGMFGGKTDRRCFTLLFHSQISLYIDSTLWFLFLNVKTTKRKKEEPVLGY